ncbi:hypothetical protein H3246_23225, partial [Escherichia coli]|nr:hypothetical protein [Escherichia coli]
DTRHRLGGTGGVHQHKAGVILRFWPYTLAFFIQRQYRLATAINAMRAAAQPHRFVGINQAGQVALLQTQGNPDGHVIPVLGVKPTDDATTIKRA